MNYREERDLIIKFLEDSWTLEEIVKIEEEEKNLKVFDFRISEIFRNSIEKMSDKVKSEEGFLRSLDKTNEDLTKHNLRKEYAKLAFLKNKIPFNEYNYRVSNILYFQIGNMFVFMGFEWESVKEGINPKFVRLEKQLNYKDASKLKRKLEIEQENTYVYFDSRLVKKYPLKYFSKKRALENFEKFIEKVRRKQEEKKEERKFASALLFSLDEQYLASNETSSPLTITMDRKNVIYEDVSKFSSREPLIGFDIFFNRGIIRYNLPNERADTLTARLTQYNENSEIILDHLGL